ncbi:hypothetical protein GA0116948_107104 [Chitinophaga costaii]|uniref:Uncharacterized protein n=1 Tax=Chitinophaga costaii TaxID=1335309 RepID=A0A1C4E5Q8_9BACT|nr:hypothetical protein GA0116948_107104 [Chitinophaga costaii]
MADVKRLCEFCCGGHIALKRENPAQWRDFHVHSYSFTLNIH